MGRVHCHLVSLGLKLVRDRRGGEHQQLHIPYGNGVGLSVILAGCGQWAGIQSVTVCALMVPGCWLATLGSTAPHTLPQALDDHIEDRDDQ